MQFFPSFFSFSKVYFLFIHSLLWPALQLTVCEYIAIHQYIRCNTVHWYSKTHLAALILTLHTILCASVLLLHVSLEASCGATDPVFHNLTTEEYPSLSKMVWAKSCYSLAESSCYCFVQTPGSKPLHLSLQSFCNLPYMLGRLWSWVCYRGSASCYPTFAIEIEWVDCKPEFAQDDEQVVTLSLPKMLIRL